MSQPPSKKKNLLLGTTSVAPVIHLHCIFFLEYQIWVKAEFFLCEVICNIEKYDTVSYVLLFLIMFL